MESQKVEQGKDHSGCSILRLGSRSVYCYPRQFLTIPSYTKLETVYKKVMFDLLLLATEDSQVGQSDSGHGSKWEIDRVCGGSLWYNIGPGAGLESSGKA